MATKKVLVLFELKEDHAHSALGFHYGRMSGGAFRGLAHAPKEIDLLSPSAAVEAGAQYLSGWLVDGAVWGWDKVRTEDKQQCCQIFREALAAALEAAGGAEK